MSYYQQHVFFCTNQRNDGRRCCEDAGASDLRAYAKAKIKQMGLSGRGKVRMNTAGCLDRCGQGPVMVVYPDEAWYSYQNEADIDEIIEQHIVKGRKVARLLLEP